MDRLHLRPSAQPRGDSGCAGFLAIDSQRQRSEAANNPAGPVPTIKTVAADVVSPIWLSGSDKTYEAVITLGVATDTADSHGTAVGAPHEGPLPAVRDRIHALFVEDQRVRTEHPNDVQRWSAVDEQTGTALREILAQHGIASDRSADLR